MISFSDVYSLLSTVVPLYVTMFLAYFSVKWWKIFTPEQCAGINKFVAVFVVPLLSFEFISRVNPYKMDLLLIAADVVSKVLILFVLFSWVKLSNKGSLHWAITLFSLATLPNTLIVGIPLIMPMYGDDIEGLLIQLVALQFMVWFTLLLFMYEYRAATTVIQQKFNGTSGVNTERSVEIKGGIQKIEIGRGDGEPEVVRMIVNRPSSSGTSDADSQTIQNFNKEAADCRRLNPIVAAAAKEDGVCEQSVQACHKEEENTTKKLNGEEATPEAMKGTGYSSTMSSEMLRHILKIVCFKLVRNPNSNASILGLSWALASCGWGFKKPQIMENSISILSNAGLGMSTFSIGLFMALQPRIIACGKRSAAYGMLVRFVAGPIVMAVASIAVGLRGTILRVAIVQAAIPQGVASFIFAREYNLHPDVLSTAVIFGMIVSLPITILFYTLLGL